MKWCDDMGLIIHFSRCINTSIYAFPQLSQTNTRTDPKSSGWQGLDELYKVGGHGYISLATTPDFSSSLMKVLPGELTIVTGVPNSGKREWLDALAVNLAEGHGWRFAFCSFEKNGKHHAAQLVEKLTGLSFFKVCVCGGGRARWWSQNAI